VVKVSVIINCYNGEKYLQEAINSIYAQTFSDWEIIFLDNDSMDRSAEIANSYDSKLKYFKSDAHVPLGAARKLAVSKAKGEWLAFLDVDDCWFKEKLEIQLDAVEDGEYVLCYAGVNEIYPNGKIIREVLPASKSGDQFEQLLLRFDINMVTPIVRRSALDHFEIDFNEAIYASEEYNLFMRLSAKGSFCSVQYVLGLRRISTGSLTYQSANKWGYERKLTLDQIKEENPGIEDQYPIAFEEAYARGEYYNARASVLNKDYFAAIKFMRGISGVSIYYKLLYYSLFLPGLWNLVHLEYVKRKVLPFIWGR